LNATPGRVTLLSLLVGVAALAGVALPAAASNTVVRATAHHQGTPRSSVAGTALARPVNLQPFIAPALAGEGIWHVAGRLVNGQPAVYTTTLRLADNRAVQAGVAWMDTGLLHARLYSGSLSPGGVFWKLTAPVSPSASRTLVAAFAGGFLLKVSGGGYLSEGHLVAPLRVGAASLVIYKNGSATVGQWGRDVGMNPSIVAVRQNLTLLVDHGLAVAGLNRNDVSAWGASLYLKPNTWRSGLGVTSTGALVYVAGPMNIVDLAQTLVRAGAVRAMPLDMNPLWPVFATYSPVMPHGPATPANGRDLLPTMIQTPARFFQPAYSRDFITMSIS
jgi:hypothetical protein